MAIFNIVNYRFNELAFKTFGIDFEDWYQNGYWGENHNPYSIVMDGKVVSNVSVNHMNFLRKGERKYRELILFYVTKYMQENVYYHKESDAFVIAEIENGCLLLHNIFSPNPIKIGQIVNSFRNDIRQVIPGFTPADCSGYTSKIRKEEDCTLFLKGKGLERFAQDGLMFPLLSHA
ncbi:MAG: hypothetical protein NC341_04315 [Blautia sp.]|nr:hypothetical protein [Blautia sp.]MCM1200860.1 hypothetical protein [Bacteroides fragilis]